MAAPAIRTATSADEVSLLDTIVLAFSADPVARWCWPDSHQYLASMPAFTSAFGGGAFAHNSAHCTEDRSGVALWLPPGVHPDEDVLGALIERTVPPSVSGDLFKTLEAMSEYHPDRPHWYLPLIGVDPVRQGNGYGSALMAHAVGQFDRDQCVAYLESTNPRNISLYRRHGFDALGEIEVGTSPPLVPMVRYPR
jgi:ribosomal protein S18 acetylase RimI-like enzyme